MKQYQLIIIALLIAAVGCMTGCEWDGPTAMWDQPYNQASAPVITEIDPDVASAGVNTITIMGENFSTDPERIKVYFDGKGVELISNTTTSVQVRRPNVIGDSITVKVINQDALEIGEFGPYQVDPVHETFGLFVPGEELSALAVDDAENVYVIARTPNTIYKVTPEGIQTAIGTSSYIVSNAKIAPDGTLLLMVNRRNVFKMNLETGEVVEWTKLSKKVSNGDFDSNGILYAGTRKSDLLVVAADGTDKQIGVYASDNILGIRVFNGYVYLLVVLDNPDEDNPETAIWRHQILDANGSLGDRELVLNWAETGEYAEAESEPLSFTFDTEGNMYIGTDNENPIFMLQADGTHNVFYKEILPTTAQKLVWGTGNYMYMIQGGETSNCLRIDTGSISGAPYYGR